MNAEFWAAIIGAVVGATGSGGITWALQDSQDRRRTKERDGALARSLVFKLVRIHSDFEGFRSHVQECVENGKQDRLAEGWQSLRPIGNLPEQVTFNSDEMGYLMGLKDFALFNDVLSLDVIHTSTLGIFALYAARRLALTDMLSTTNMQGTVGTAQVNAAQHAFFAPKAAELNLLASDIRGRVEKDSKESRDALERVNVAIKPTLGYSLSLEFPKEGAVSRPVAVSGRPT